MLLAGSRGFRNSRESGESRESSGPESPGNPGGPEGPEGPGGQGEQGDHMYLLFAVCVDMWSWQVSFKWEFVFCPNVGRDAAFIVGVV